MWLVKTNLFKNKRNKIRLWVWLLVVFLLFALSAAAFHGCIHHNSQCVLCACTMQVLWVQKAVLVLGIEMVKRRDFLLFCMTCAFGIGTLIQRKTRMNP